MLDLPLHMHDAARWCHLRGLHRTARILTWATSLIFACSLAPEADIGENTRLHHHALGIVIHPCTSIGRDCHILHHVTLATDVPHDSGQRMVIGDRVSIGANSVVVGPRVIGDDATIGAGSVVIEDVPSGATVVGNPARVVSVRAS